MALGQTLESPLTLYSGSIISNTVPAGDVQGNLLYLPTASLPAFQTSPWQFRIKTDPFSTVSSTQQVVGDLNISLENSTKYLIVAYVGVSNTSSTSATRLGVSSSAAENYYSIEVPSSATAVTIGNLQTASPASFPANSSATNYYFAKITALVITAAAGSPTWAPTISTLTATTTTAAIGPSVVYYRSY